MADIDKKPNIIRTEDHPTIVAAGATTLILSPGMRPKRVVLRKVRNEYVTHVEYMHIRTVRETVAAAGECDVIVLSHEDFDHGHYFPFGGHTGKTEDEARNAAIDDWHARTYK